MSRETREALIKQLMGMGKTFEEVYKESDGTPYFKWWIWESDSAGGYLVSDKSNQEIEKHMLTLQAGATFKREDSLGYSIDL